jgi:hypothetical protein
MPTSEIEKLERRYAENPQGLTFAPLAEIHRKNGDVARALELLHAGLELHPNYIPASIVLGRCHWDLGDLPAAESAFAHVLRLDDENVIALKSLADINERLERWGEAQRWLHRLVSVDRSNEEARQQLNRLELAKERGVPANPPQEVAPVDSPAVEVPPPVASAPQAPGPAEVAPLDLIPEIAEPASRIETSEPAGKQPETKPVTLEFLDTSQPASPAEGETPGAPEEPAPLPGLISQEFVAPKESTYRLHPELTQEFVSSKESSDRWDVETAEQVELRSSGAAEFRVPNAAEDFLDLAARMNAARDDSLKLDSDSVPPSREIAGERRATSWESVAAQPVPADLKPAATDAVSEVTRSYAASETKGQSVSAFFQALLAARPPGNSGSHAASPSAAGSAAAMPPPQDALSVGSPSGQESVPAVPASGPKDAVVSFDDFFGAAGGRSPLPKGSTDPGNDDLDQFQSWLQNLKR